MSAAPRTAQPGRPATRSATPPEDSGSRFGFYFLIGTLVLGLLAVVYAVLAS